VLPPAHKALHHLQQGSTPPSGPTGRQSLPQPAARRLHHALHSALRPPPALKFFSPYSCSGISKQKKTFQYHYIQSNDYAEYKFIM
jgi:hypothetical protein